MKHKKAVVSRYLHQFDGIFSSITAVRIQVAEELSDDVPVSKFDVGYYENRSSKNLLVQLKISNLCMKSSKQKMKFIYGAV